MNRVILFTILFTGCSESSELTALKLSLRMTGDEILSATTSTGDKIDENTEALRGLKTQVEILEASLVESQTQKVQEVINSSRIAPDNTANDSHPATLIVAESGAVRLLVSLADFACAPCDRLKQAVNDGEFNGFDVQYTDDWRPGSYPAIRYPTASSSTGWAVMYGYDDRTISRLRAATNPVVSQARNTTAVMSHAQQVAEHNRMHGGGNWTWPGDLATHLRDTHGVNLASNRGAPVGAIFQNYRSGTVTSQRSNIRPVSRWVGYGGRSRNKSSAACPAGGCP